MLGAGATSMEKTQSLCSGGSEWAVKLEAEAVCIVALPLTIYMTWLSHLSC